MQIKSFVKIKLFAVDYNLIWLIAQNKQYCNRIDGKRQSVFDFRMLKQVKLCWLI